MTSTFKTLPNQSVKFRICAGALSTLAALGVAGCSGAPPQDATNNAAQDTSTPAADATTNAASKNATEKFTNSPQGLEGALKKNYAGFSFDYPSNWQYKREGGDPNSSNFVKVENALRDKVKGDFTLENFAVGYFQSSGDAASDAKLFPQAVKQLNAPFAAKWPHYQKISEGPTTVGTYKGYEFRFQSRFEKTKFGPVTLWGRMILLPNPKPGKRNGVALILLATSLQKDLKSASDLGVKGESPVILKSFKFE